MTILGLTKENNNTVIYSLDGKDLSYSPATIAIIRFVTNLYL